MGIHVVDARIIGNVRNTAKYKTRSSCELSVNHRNPVGGMMWTLSYRVISEMQKPTVT